MIIITGFLYYAERFIKDDFWFMFVFYCNAGIESYASIAIP